MEQSQYDQIHRIAVLARELCKKRNHAAMELVNTSDAAWNNLFDLIGKLGNQYIFKKPKYWCNRWFTGCGIVKDMYNRDKMVFYPNGMDDRDARGSDGFSYDHEILFILSITDHIVRELGEP